MTLVAMVLFADSVPSGSEVSALTKSLSAIQTVWGARLDERNRASYKFRRQLCLCVCKLPLASAGRNPCALSVVVVLVAARARRSLAEQQKKQQPLHTEDLYHCTICVYTRLSQAVFICIVFLINFRHSQDGPALLQRSSKMSSIFV